MVGKKDFTITSIDNFSKEQLFEMAFYEPVTHYYNWNWLRERLENFEKFGLSDFIFAHFDIKDFKMINEIYGHTVGDKVLIRMCDALSKCDWIYFSSRCDNDNFALMVKRMSDEEVRAKLQALFDSLSVLDEDSKYPIFYRCGVASVDNVGDYRATVTDLAKMAQRLGTKVNVTEIHFYTDEMKEKQMHSKLLKKDLTNALENDELIVYYQPKYEPVHNTLVGAEALIRWNYHHERMLPPGEFVPYFEQEGAIEKIDRFVLEQVCMKLEHWKQQGIKLVPISVNMSRAQLYSPLVIDNILAIVDRYDVERQYIEFELTESLAYGDVDYMIQVMKELRELGFLLSIDDFGTGYSSLSLLSNMPLTTLKIDKSFIDEIEMDEDGKVDYIVKNILGITKHLSIYSVAEGVETEDQKNLLKKWGCNYIQGYFYSRPIPVEEFEKFLEVAE
ncbi:MAG: GGDEF domain-containing phosphodiesterase [Eubacteriales bacterium]|nr:GGDEF domain-containing phosphodiesterase [Eubacteriales bacterium]